jgi:hypothetical protein
MRKSPFVVVVVCALGCSVEPGPGEVPSAADDQGDPIEEESGISPNWDAAKLFAPEVPSQLNFATARPACAIIEQKTTTIRGPLIRDTVTTRHVVGVGSYKSLPWLKQEAFELSCGLDCPPSSYAKHDCGVCNTYDGPHIYGAGACPPLKDGSFTNNLITHHYGVLARTDLDTGAYVHLPGKYEYRGAYCGSSGGISQTNVVSTLLGEPFWCNQRDRLVPGNPKVSLVPLLALRGLPPPQAIAQMDPKARIVIGALVLGELAFAVVTKVGDMNGKTNSQLVDEAAAKTSANKKIKVADQQARLVPPYVSPGPGADGKCSEDVKWRDDPDKPGNHAVTRACVKDGVGFAGPELLHYPCAGTHRHGFWVGIDKSCRRHIQNATKCVAPRPPPLANPIWGVGGLAFPTCHNAAPATNTPVSVRAPHRPMETYTRANGCWTGKYQQEVNRAYWSVAPGPSPCP